MAAYRVRQILNKPFVRNDHPLLQDYWEIDLVARQAQSNPLLRFGRKQSQRLLMAEHFPSEYVFYRVKSVFRL